MAERVTLYHSPNTRSTGVLTLLEELGVEYDLHPVNMKAGAHRHDPYLAINPMGKVPALRHRGHLVSEQVAIFIYLADLYPEAGLAPTLESAWRGPYLRMIAFYGSAFEPAVIDRALKREQAPVAMSPYGTFDAVLETLTAALRPGPYLLGETLTAADILWGTALGWTTGFKLVPESPEIMDYIGRITSRPAFVRAREKDAALDAAQAVAA